MIICFFNAQEEILLIIIPVYAQLSMRVTQLLPPS